VLDLFAGNNLIWKNFKCVKYFGVEKVKGKGNNLNADNNRIIESLDLSEFNIIDADSYGIPFNQIEKIYNNHTLKNETIILYTLITNKMSMINKACIKTYNLATIYKKTKTLVNAKAHELFYGYLYENNVTELWRCLEKSNPKFYKEYGYFIVSGRVNA